MLSCLRILRLLSLTHGTAIILRSLKKAAPLLVRVAFLLCFFWLLFAIIGVQSFKASFSRQCIWLDPFQPTNLSAAFTNDDQLCGGYLSNETGTIMPWVKFGNPNSLEGLVPGAGKGKGFICPRGSLCLQQDNPSNGTVNFDNILQSLELVFVIMSANTFSDLMYQTMASDYQQAALFFGAGIMIMTLWLTNLLIAVITSSFQIIREESKGSAFTSDHRSSIQPHFDDRTRKSTLQRVVKKTKLLFTLIIVFGLICQACRSARMSPSREKFINGAEIAVTLLLDVELSVRLASNWRSFHRSWANLFDLGLGTITTVILIPPIRHTPAYWWLTVFQIVRAYRIVLVVPMTRKLILLVLGNAAGIANLMLFVFLMTFLVSIFASQLFRGEIPVFNDSGELNRVSFFTIYNSFLGMYQILSSENWTDILYSVTSYAHGYKTGWIGATFLIGWFTLSYFILVNMFIAVIQENFDVSEDEKRLEQVKAFLQRKELGHNASNLALSSIFNLAKSRRRRDPLDYGPAMMEMLLKDAVVREFLDDENAEPLQVSPENDGAGRSPSTFPRNSSSGLVGVWQRFKNKFTDQEPNPFYTSIKFDGPNDTLDPRQMARQVAAFVSISLLIPFAIYGLNIFNGKMISCNDGDDITRLAQCFGEYGSTPFKDDWVMLAPRVADNSYFKFDDFGSSLFTLYQIVSQEGWTDVSFAAQAITGRGLQPQDLAAQGNAMFFVVFNLLATVFVLTLFISVFMRNYTEQTGVAFLTAEQRSWLELKKLLRRISPSKSSYNDKGKEWKRWCHKRAIEKRGKWYQMITVVLVFHLVLLIAEFDNEPRWWSRTREFVSLLFILIYMSNIAIRIFGLGWSRFRKSSWDLYALVVVSGAFIATLSLLIASARGKAYEQLYKTFLVAIILLLIPRNDALDQLFKTAAASLTVISNLLATWLVLFLVFAIAMTQAFSLTRFGGQGTSDLNFRTVPNALILLFRMSLGEGWNEIMEDYAGIEPPLCVKDSTFFDSDCGSKPWARILFVGWNIISMYIFVNLFVSLIYESFSYVYQRSSGMAVVDRDEIRRFKEAWRSVDSAGTGYITKSQFPRLLGELSGIFQMRIYDPEDSVSQILDHVRNDGGMSRHSSVVVSKTGSKIDLGKLNTRLMNLDIERIRTRRRVFNIFFEEVLVAADPDRGIAFSDVLLILAHYKIINDSKSLRLDEFLRRRARLQRVDEEIRRRIVLGFFDTLYWSRKFKQHMSMKRSARMTMVPQLSVPEILVDDEESNVNTAAGTSDKTNRPLLPSLNTNLETPKKPSVWAAEISPRDSGIQHPLSFPKTSGGGLSPPASPMRTGFQLSPSGASNADSERRGRSLSPAQARGMLDDSVWVESIRKSKTLRHSDKSTYRYGDLD
ncbi:hypothetical protein MY10362_008987 [Beauveria mimosiformis]